MTAAGRGRDCERNALMNSPAGGDRRFHQSHRLFLIAIAVIAGILLAAGLAVWNRRDEALARASREMGDLGVLLAAQSSRSLQAVDLVLQEVQGVVRAAGITTPEQFRQRMGGEEVHAFLLGTLRSLPQADAVSLLDASGGIVNLSRAWPIPRTDMSDDDFYRHFQSRDDRGIFIGEPAIDKGTGHWAIPLARRIEAPDGTLLGIVASVIEVRYVEEFYRTIATSEGESIALFRRDGTMLARFPHSEDVGRKLPAQAGWYALAERGGTYRSAGLLDGDRRVVSIRPVPDFPLVVSFAITEDAVLADWRRQSVWVALGALAASLGFGLLFRVLAMQSNRLEHQAEDLEEAAAALSKSEARFRDFAMTSSDWVWETDAEHRFTYHSDSIRDFGQDPSARLGRTRIELAADAATEGDKWEEHRALLDRHEPFRDFVYRRKIGDDPEAYISVSGKPIFDPAGKFLGYRGTVREITREVLSERSLRAAKSAAEAASLAKSQFLANMSHELLTPLNAILGFSEMLEQGFAGPLQPQQQEYSLLIHQSGEHLLNVINEILDLARVDAGKLELRDEEAVDPRHMIESCVRLIAARAAAGEMPRLCYDIDDGIPQLIVDATRLTQILLNLLSNAVKFTGSEGTITVALRRRADGGVEFEVRDTGAGMTAAEIEIALEPFGQVDSAHARRHEGTGLGLPLARRLAELHGGALIVRSEKGRGTAVIVVLPASRVHDGNAVPGEPSGQVLQVE
jgi:two-component system cell cycle sensor histidine kinase PleC